MTSGADSGGSRPPGDLPASGDAAVPGPHPQTHDRRPGVRRMARALDALAAVQLELDAERLQRRGAEALLDQLLAAMSDALLLADARGVVVRANAAAGRLHGRDPGALTGQPVAALFDGGVPASAWRLLEAATGGHVACEAGALDAAGNRVPVSVSSAVVRDHAGKIEGTVHVARDLSQTQRLLREVEAAEARWRLLATLGDRLNRELDPQRALPELVGDLSAALGCHVAIVCGDGLQVQEVAIAPQDAIGRALRDLQGRPLPPGTALEAAVRGGRVVHAAAARGDFPLFDRGGSAFASFVLAPLTGRGASLGALLIAAVEPGMVDGALADLAEQVAARVALTLANARLRAATARFDAVRDATRLRTEIVAGVSHDIQTPIAVLMASLESLRTHGTDLPPAGRAQLLDTMDRNLHRLRRLVSQFLDFSRLEAGHPLPLRPVPTDVGEVVHRVAREFRGKAPVHTDVPQGLGPALVDPERFEQVLITLVANAVAFSPRDQPVSVTVAGGREELEVAVQDHGPGIGVTELPHLFEKPHAGAGGDTGLGLYLVKVLVDAMGGGISVTSRMGAGSRFTVTIPAALRTSGRA